MKDDSGQIGYMSTQLQYIQKPEFYNRSRYAMQGWQTYGDEFGQDRNVAILSIGPGGCEFEEYLKAEQLYTNLEVVDTSTEVIAKAEGLGFKATLCEDLAEFLRANSERFDRIIMLHVLEHIPKAVVIETLSAIRGALKPGGVLFLEVPNMGDPFNSTYFRYSDFTHEMGYAEESLRYVLTHAGFTKLEFLTPRTSPQPVMRRLQLASRRLLKSALIAITLPNGRQMTRRIDPVLAVAARP